MKIAITGSSGMIGRKLSARLESLGHEVVPVSYRINNQTIKKDLTISIKNESATIKRVNDADILIHLAGANISKTWTKKHKNEILKSRSDGSREIFNWIFQNAKNINKVISTSAIGIYKNPCIELISENSDKGAGFLSNVCREWEKSLEVIPEKVEVGIVRVGLVLSKEAGIYPISVLTKNLGIIPITGSKNNYWSWIHIDDLVEVYVAMVENKIKCDTYNAVAPNPVKQEAYARSVFENNKQKCLIPVRFSPVIPPFFLKLILGERSQLPLTSQNISSKKLTDLGFNFNYPTISLALQQLINE